MSLLATKNGEIKGENGGGYIGLKRGGGGDGFRGVRGAVSETGSLQVGTHFAYIFATFLPKYLLQCRQK